MLPVVPRSPAPVNVKSPPTLIFVAYALVNGIHIQPSVVVPAPDITLPAVKLVMCPCANLLLLEPKSNVLSVVGIASVPAWNTALADIFAESDP